MKQVGLKNDETFCSAATEHGKRYETEAIAEYERRTGRRVLSVGLVQHRELPWLGASPDGITAQEGIAIEVKCPISRLIKDAVPSQYWAQCQTVLEVLDVEELDFVQYKPASPPSQPDIVFSCVRVQRDRRWFEETRLHLERFVSDWIAYHKTGILPEYVNEAERTRDAKRKKNGTPTREEKKDGEESASSMVHL